MIGLSRRRFLGTASILGAIVAPNGFRRAFAGAAAAGPGIPMTLGEAKGAGQSAQFAVGVRSGAFRQHGMGVSLRIFGSGAEMGPALVAGSLSIIATGDIPAIPIMASGAPIKALCPLSDFSSDQAIVVQAAIKEPKDLLDKKIALFKGSVASLLIERYAAHHGLDLERIHLIHMPPPQQMAALAGGDIDGYVSWEPFIWSGTQRIPGAHVLARANEPVDYMKVFDLLLVREDYLQSNGEAVRKLLAGLLQALEFMQSGDDASLRMAATHVRAEEQLDLPVEVLVSMMKRRRYTMSLDKDLLDVETQNTDFLMKMGKISHKPTPQSWLDPEPLRSVKPDLVSI